MMLLMINTYYWSPCIVILNVSIILLKKAQFIYTHIYILQNFIFMYDYGDGDDDDASIFVLE